MRGQDVGLLCALWLAGSASLQAAELQELDFYLAQIPGVYEERDGQFVGIYVDMLNDMATYAGIRFRYQLAPRDRAVLELSHKPGCSSFTLLEPVHAPAGMVLLKEVGRTQIAAYVLPASTLSMKEVSHLPVGQVMAFGEDISLSLHRHGIDNAVIKGSLARAISMLQAGRFSVLFTTPASLSGLPAVKLRQIAVFGSMSSWFACSSLLGAELQQRLLLAWSKVKIPAGK